MLSHYGMLKCGYELLEVDGSFLRFSFVSEGIKVSLHAVHMLLVS